MTPERVRRIKAFFDEAIELPVEQRAAFLAEACGGDQQLLDEVQQLLGELEDAPAGATVTERLPSAAPNIAPILANSRYALVKELGRGGFGVVYQALDRKLHDRPVVVKVLHSGTGSDEWSRKKFRYEVQALARINHPGIVGVLDSGETPDGHPYLVMDFIEGTTLRAAISSSGLPLKRMASIVRQIGQALGAAHEKGVQHRDLKPENVMLQDAGDEEHVILIDFGVAAITDSSTSPSTTKPVGTPAYMAPEQLMGAPVQVSDIYAMGVIAYEMATGRVPFSLDSPLPLHRIRTGHEMVKPKHLRPELPPTAQDLILSALSVRPGDRPQNARDFSKALADALVAESLPRTLLMGDPNLGRLIFKMCNRRPQEDEFKHHVVSCLREQPGLPQIFFMYGEEGECHDSLVERLSYQLELIAQRTTASYRAPVLRKNIPWQYEGSLETRRARLIGWLFDQFSMTGPPAAADLKPDSFANLLTRCLHPFVVVQHDIRTARWDKFTEGLLVSYLRFWGELSSRLVAPQIIVFLNLISPSSPGRWLELLLRAGRLRRQLRRRRIEAQLRGITAAHHGCSCVVLDELKPVTRDDVMEWFSLHNILHSERERLEAAERIFRSGNRVVASRRMAEVEDQLTSIHAQFIGVRGYV
jgi:serine/threonine protein kinase